MTISNLFKNSGYAAVFGFMGLIVGIWTAESSQQDYPA